MDFSRVGVNIVSSLENEDICKVPEKMEPIILFVKSNPICAQLYLHSIYLTPNLHLTQCRYSVANSVFHGHIGKYLIP